MAHTDRQPTDEVFKDIVNAAQNVWVFGQSYHESYVQEQLDHINSMDNFADNWYSLIGRMDETNQLIFTQHVKLQSTIDFLKEQRQHYRYVLPREYK